jgi:hypothetical protein
MTGGVGSGRKSMTETKRHLIGKLAIVSVPLVALATVRVRAGNAAQGEETYKRVSALPEKVWVPAEENK